MAEYIIYPEGMIVPYMVTEDKAIQDKTRPEQCIQNEFNQVEVIRPIIPKMEFNIRPTVTQEWTVKRLLDEDLPDGWEDVFNRVRTELEETSEKIEQFKRETGCLPFMSEIFNAFHYTPLSEVKVVIIGQDPYHTGIAAHGLSFSIRRGEDIQPSLRNIFKELERDIVGFKSPDHGDLTKWAKQGVMMLNACLTVTPKAPGSHGMIWMALIKEAIKAICVKRPGTIFVLWGSKAQEIRSYISSACTVLTASHPSPFSVKGFTGCGHFSKINRRLRELKKPEIDWRLD